MDTQSEVIVAESAEQVERREKSGSVSRSKPKPPASRDGKKKGRSRWRFSLRNMRIGKRLGWGFGIVVVITIGVAAAGYWGTKKVTDAVLHTLNTDAKLEQTFSAVRVNTLDLRRYEKDAFLNMADKAKLSDYLDKWEATDARLHERLSELQKVGLDSYDSDAMERITAALKDYEDGFRDVAKRVQAQEIKRPEDGNAAVTPFKPAIHAMEDTAQQSDAEHAARMQDQVKVVESTRARTMMVMLSIVVAGILVSAVISVGMTRSISKPLVQAAGAVQVAAKGDLRAEIETKGRDEIAQMGEGLAQFLGGLRKSIGKMAEDAQSLASASEEMTTVSQQMSANAEETSSQASQVTAASEEVSRNLQTVATGAEEMSSSIQEIAKNATEAAKVASEAVKVAETTNTTVTRLGESSAAIGEVVKVITSIARQTHLLALNANIEAARAGKAGLGFGVVATEVKELAEKTSKATADIGQKVSAIQDDVRAAVEAIGSIAQIITRVNDISGTIATAVEEQNATTNEISRNVTEAANGANSIVKNISGVAEAAQSTARGAQDTQTAAKSMAGMSSEMRELVGQFQY